MNTAIVDTPTPPATPTTAAAAPAAPGKPAAPTPPPHKHIWRKLAIWGLVLAAIAGGIVFWFERKPSGPGKGFVSGNGRIEATEIDIATKLAGPVNEIDVIEGDYVESGQVMAKMRIDGLLAQREEARANSRQYDTAVASALAKVAAFKAVVAAEQATVAQRRSDLVLDQRKFARMDRLFKTGAASQEDYDIDIAAVRSAEAAVTSALAQVTAAEAAVKAADAGYLGAIATAQSSVATIARVEADIQDSTLRAPRAGRVQYRIAQPGEVLAGGGKVLNLVDLSDVYLTFFLPETAAGSVAMGSEVRIVLDAAPKIVIPATVSYVSSTAQFTPKTVETAVERQKLMFRVKAQIGRELLLKNLKLVKTGLPGIAWIKLDPAAVWPANLQINVPE